MKTYASAQRRLDEMQPHELRELCADLFSALYPEGPESDDFDPGGRSTVEAAISECFSAAGIAPPLKCETDTPEVMEEIIAAFEVSDHFAKVDDFEDVSTDTFFEHGQWFVRLTWHDEQTGEDCEETYSVSDAEPGPFVFEQL